MATITAGEMARDAGVSLREFQGALKAAAPKWHASGTHWMAECGSKREADMRAVLNAMLQNPATRGVKPDQNRSSVARETRKRYPRPQVRGSQRRCRMVEDENDART